MIDSLSKKVKNFPKVEIVFMDEEVDKIPEFFDYAGSKYNYIVLDISTFYDVLTWERDTPGIFYMWNGNILKELLKHWKMAHISLERRHLPRIFKKILQVIYVDHFYKYLIQNELAELEK